MINENFNNEYKVVVAPGPNEIEEAHSYNANIVLNEKKHLNLIYLGKVALLFAL